MLLAKIVLGLPLNKFTNETVALTIYGAITNYLGNSYYQKLAFGSLPIHQSNIGLRVRYKTQNLI